MKIEGTLSIQDRADGLGQYYEIMSKDLSSVVAVTMTSSLTPEDDTSVFGPLIGKNVVAEGALILKTGMLMAFTIKEI